MLIYEFIFVWNNTQKNNNIYYYYDVFSPYLFDSLSEKEFDTW